MCAVSGVALEISEKQRVRLQQQAMAMTQYCGMMHNRAKSMLRFIQKECPSNRGDVLTQFKKKYPMYGLRTMTMNIIKKFGKFVLFFFSSCLLVLHTHTYTHTPHPGIKSADTFTRWRTHYLTHGSFRPDRRGRFTSGFLLRHDDLKLALTRYLLSKVKRDINISEVRCLPVCLPAHPHPHPHSPPLITDTRFYKRNFA